MKIARKSLDPSLSGEGAGPRD